MAECARQIGKQKGLLLLNTPVAEYKGPYAMISRVHSQQEH